MTLKTQTVIKEKTKESFSLGGIEKVSIRNIAKTSGVSSSVLYHYWSGQEDLLQEIFNETKKELGKKRAKLSKPDNTKDMLRQRIEFQFDNALDVVFILKFYTHYRSNFVENDSGFVPKEAYTHILEVLKYGVLNGEFANTKLTMQAKVITHAINGFVLEYYPNLPEGKEKQKLVDEINNFIYRAIIKGGENNEQ